MDILGKAKEALEKGKDVAGDALDKAKEVAGDAAEKAKDLGGTAVDKVKEVAGDTAEKASEVAHKATAEGSFLDKVKDKAEELTGIDINRDGKIGDKPKE